MAYSMIGSKVIEFDWKNFASGMGTSNYAKDGGFSPGNEFKSIVNPIAVPGVLYGPGATTDKSANLEGEMMCSCEDPTGTAARLFLARDTATQDGSYYYMDSTGSLTLKRTDSSNDYVFGRSDMIGFGGEVYATSVGAITRWVPDSTFNTSFFSFADAIAPHPALTFENNAFYGDGNELLRQTAPNTTPTVILTLPSNQVIVALGIDPGSGRMLLSVVDQYNVSGTLNSQARVLYYDGFSNKPVKIVLIDDMITAFYNVGSSVFVFYGQKMGFWNGAGIDWLRNLSIDLDNTQLVYKNHVTNIGQTLYVIEKRWILAYGEIVKGSSPVFYYASQNENGTTGNFSLVTNIGSNRLGFGLPTEQFYTFNVLDVSTLANGGARFYTHNIEFDRIVTFNQIIVEFDIALSTAGINQVTALLLTDLTTLGSDTTAINMGSANTTVAGTTSWTFPWPTAETRNIQFRLGTGTTNIGVKRISVFVNPKD